VSFKAWSRLPAVVPAAVLPETKKTRKSMDSNEDKNPDQSRRLDLLLDVPLDIAVELGRARMSIQDLLALAPGSVIELDKIAGEALDIMVNDRLVARGEAVVVNDKFGIRITDIVSQAERIARLR
jgi:flagellar motor switch protein FliN